MSDEVQTAPLPRSWPKWYLAFPAILLAVLPFPHTIVLRIAMLGATLAAALFAWRNLAVPRLPCRAALVIWVVVCAASVPMAVDVRYSLGELKNEVGYGVVAFVSFFALTRDVRTLRLFLLASGASLLVIVVAALFTYAARGSWMPEVWYGESPLVSHYLVIAVPAALCGVYLSNPRHLRVITTILAMLVAVCVVLTGQRATWFAIGAQLLAAGMCFSRRRGDPGWDAKAALALVAIFVVAAAGLFVTEQFRISTEPLAALEKDQRLEVWGNIGERISDHPWVGAGLGRETMKRAYPELIPPENPLFWHAHNMVLDYGLSAGIPGMVAIVLLFFALATRFFSLSASLDPTLRALGACGCAIVVGVFTRNMFNDFFLRDGALLFWALCGALLGCGLRESGSLPG